MAQQGDAAVCMGSSTPGTSPLRAAGLTDSEMLSFSASPLRSVGILPNAVGIYFQSDLTAPKHRAAASQLCASNS